MHCVWSFDDGYRIKHLHTVTAFLRDSKVRRNCLHNLNRFLESEVLSLRDPDDQPHAAIEFRKDLLILVRGFANSALRQKYYPLLLACLTDRGVPESEIIARLGLIDFNDEAHLDIDHCVQTFSKWLMTLQYPDENPFMHHKTVRKFLNIYARYRKSARPKTQKSSFHTSNQDAGFSRTGWQVRNVFRATFRLSIPNCPALSCSSAL